MGSRRDPHMLSVVTPPARRARLVATMELVFESTRIVTQPEFAAWVDERARSGDIAHYELLQGRVVMTPPAGYPHGEIESRIHVQLANFVAARQLGKVFGSSQGFELPTGDTVEPDVSFVSTERWNAALPPERGKFLRVVPDLVVEVLSTSTASHDRGEKKATYGAAGVREYWLLDGRAREVIAYVLENGRYGQERAFTAGAARSLVLAGLVVDVAGLFP